MKLLVIGAVVLLLLGGGGFAAWWFFLSEPEEAEVAEAATAGPEPQIIDLKPFDVPIMVNGRVTHRITFKLYLDLLPDHTIKSLQPLMPKIQDAVYSELHALFGMRYVRDMDNILPVVKLRVRQAANRALGGGAIGQVLVANINKKRTLQHHRHEITGRGRAGNGRRLILPSIPN